MAVPCRDAELLGSYSLDLVSKICWHCTWFCWGRLAWHVLTQGAHLLVHAAELAPGSTSELSRLLLTEQASACEAEGTLAFPPTFRKNFYTLQAEGIARVLRLGWTSCLTA